jgi:hypothetical protein
MTTYKVMDFQFEEIENYMVEGQAEISIFKDGDVAGEWMTHAVEYVDIDSVTDEDGNEVTLEPKSLEHLETLVAERILELDLDYDEETERGYD